MKIDAINLNLTNNMGICFLFEIGELFPLRLLTRYQRHQRSNNA